MKAKIISMIITAHLETYFTIVLAQSDTTKNFLHSIFYALNPDNFSTTSNNQFTCFPFFMPRRNLFVKTIFLTELVQNSLYDKQLFLSHPLLNFCGVLRFVFFLIVLGHF